MIDIPDWLGELLQWLKELLLWVPQQLWSLLMDALESLINAIPVPAFVADLATRFGDLGAGLLYFMDVLQFDIGIPMILLAYTARFLIRRLPFIG